MGLFNYVRCRYPLPDPEAQELVFQTKSMLDLQLATYEVTPDGRLIQVEKGGFDVVAEACQPSAASDSPSARPDVASWRFTRPPSSPTTASAGIRICCGFETAESPTCNAAPTVDTSCRCIARKERHETRIDRAASRQL